ncbi:hypothetical protein BO82DRAFT_403263 [Aspergillus uvarum CBS 121591]|uniref:Uncharacterized protein n=4 Tax=Aspergillus TaxID=5052 RepID=A0A319C5N8_9EURO|nr:hypothetical protein BO82DRAFT_403263 [Aspergillus uvarum CBS 121591]XP_025522687.1 hypothetical protein BO86DRAFT_422890 [Aspergillus japonicus CBS 114.51]PYI14485.1 hypothetical protein BO99DRAFT_437284 [Aspergillus violaceofuscus CBS 115571]PYI33220.1 hypothetical protein BP00DRAFT_339568 [Aspergillus indologenus CBS 114.80]PYH80474.1 hypothetical protein BO82DRAFT_403263 [Aspergillus uvarum CBS 121591]RAH76793.1 hypothetical protein BO86DRAFT_422890 [Aspergillus japonicus CBS 114.51]
MFSCANYPRGCRGRVNINGGKCPDCVQLKLRHPRSTSPFAQPRDYRRALPSEILNDSPYKEMIDRCA